MLIKFSTSEDFKSDVLPVAIVTDSKQLFKRAGSERFKHVKVGKHQTPVHIIALGSYEGTGSNRNEDLFFEQDCKDYHHTFVKAGRAIHHNHRNKPKDPKYGDIYASDYNEPMKRIEIMIGLDNDSPKNAKTLQKLSEDKQVTGSMACAVPYDECTLCKHKAPDSDKRCEHIPSRLGEITKHGIKISMINRRPRYFEYSIVERGADRIAWSINKHASCNDNCVERYENNQKQAQEIYVPPSLTLSKYASSKRFLLDKIAKLEKHIDTIASGKIENSEDKYIKEHSAKLNQTPQIDDKTISKLRSFEDHNKLLKALSDKGIIFTPEEFCKYIFDNKLDSSHVDDMKSHLPSIHNELKNESEELHNEDFQPEEGNIPSSILNLVKELTNDHSLFSEPAHNRIMKITIIKSKPLSLKKESSDKSDSVFAKQLALKYANYQLSTLSYMDDNNKLDNDIIINTLIQNRR